MSETTQSVFSIEKIYVKDMSLEVPNAPQVFLEREQPQIDVSIHSEAGGLDEGIYQVVLTVTVTARLGEKTVFLVEVAQGGIFQIRNVPDGEMEPLLAIVSPNILFPYVRETISDTISRAGFQPVYLAPVNFEAIYQQSRQGAQQPVEVPIQ